MKRLTKRLSPKCLWFLILLTVLTMVCLVPQMKDLYLNSRCTVAVELGNAQNVSIRETKIIQGLLLEGDLQKLQIYLDAPSGALYGDAEVVFTLRQGENTVSRPVKAVTLETGFYELSANFGKIKTGQATLEIEGINFPAGTDVYLLASDTQISGLPMAFSETAECIGPLFLRYEILKNNFYFWYDTALLVALFAVILGTAWGIAFYRENMQDKNLLFLCSVLLIFLYVSLQNPPASFLAEPFSEVVYEFWYKAHEYGFFKSLMALMSGESLVWLERIMMWTADALFPTRYVMVAAQLMQLLLIACVASMPCLKIFSRYFGPEARILFSFYTGALMMFPSAYYFWGVSYWASFFLIYFGMLEMERMKRWQFLLGLGFTVILCVSRIYHIVYIPIVLLLLFLLWKQKGKRFKLYCAVVAVSSAFEVSYSLLMGGQRHFSAGGALNLLRVAENSLYYQVQVISSFFFGVERANGLGSNLLCTAFLLAVVVLFLFTAFSPLKKNKSIAALLGSMGILSLGTVAINVVVCAMSSTVTFPHNYAAEVDWKTNFFQQADFHFSYAYIAIAILSVVLLYMAKQVVQKWLSKNLSPKAYSDFLPKYERGSCAAALCIALLFSTMVSQTKPRMRYIPVEWKALAPITEREAYYAAVNIDYGVADISLEHNSRGMILGYDADADHWFFWNKEKERVYDTKTPYHHAVIGDVGALQEKEILSITAEKALWNFEVFYVAVLRDRNGTELARLLQINSPDRVWMDFIPDHPIRGVSSVTFELIDGTPAYVQNALQIGVKADDRMDD